jgi:hypothetical protein
MVAALLPRELDLNNAMFGANTEGRKPSFKLTLVSRPRKGPVIMWLSPSRWRRSMTSSLGVFKAFNIKGNGMLSNSLLKHLLEEKACERPLVVSRVLVIANGLARAVPSP